MRATILVGRGVVRVGRGFSPGAADAFSLEVIEDGHLAEAYRGGFFRYQHATAQHFLFFEGPDQYFILFFFQFLRGKYKTQWPAQYLIAQLYHLMVLFGTMINNFKGHSGCVGYATVCCNIRIYRLPRSFNGLKIA